MAGQITLWGADQFLNSFFSKTSAPPDSFWLALITDTVPTPYLSGAELAEPTADDYSRLEIPNDSVNWSNDGQVQVMMLDQDISFSSATSDWGQISFWAITNAIADGNPYFIGDFDTSQFISTGDAVAIAAGNITVSIGPFYAQTDT